ncbi:MAG: rod shape-determining protein [Oscillospiraceae bacterium]|nr:rod shape-determining protein [Oscillospiraceae bacterium]
MQIKEQQMFTRQIGIDLGTANTLIYVRGKGIVLREPSVVAVNTRTDQASSVGKEAKEIIGRTPGSMIAVHPLKDGVIADFDIAATMLQELIRKALKGTPFSRARVLICIPSGVTAVERRAVKEAAEKAGARPVQLVLEPIAAALGAGLKIMEPAGTMIVDIGGGTSEVAVISMGGIVASRSVRTAGDAFDMAIVNYVRRKYNLLIGERTAEAVKIGIGSAFPETTVSTMELRGRNLLNGLPENITVNSEEVREALSEPLGKVLEAIRETLADTPPELSADILEQGITLAGGSALLRGMDKLINRETGMPVYVAEYPLDCVAEGTGRIMENLGQYEELLAEEIRYYV